VNVCVALESQERRRDAVMNCETFTAALHGDKAGSIGKDEKYYQAVSDWISEKWIELVMERYRFHTREGGDKYRAQLQGRPATGDPL
jgi:hypothetical protein